MKAALARARETLRTTRILAECLGGTRWRDILVLEALALEAIIKRLERRANLTAADMAEVDSGIDGIPRLHPPPKTDSSSGGLH